jgi:hypothetical protein
MVEYPSKEVAAMVSRTTQRASREWTANDDDAGHHHGLIDLNEVPCYIALYWSSKSKGRTVHVGTYKLNLRLLVSKGYAQEKPGRKVRLRFVRDESGVIMIRANDSTPGLLVGIADFAATAS